MKWHRMQRPVFPIGKENAVFMKMVCNTSLMLLANLLAGNLPSLAQDKLPGASGYRGEILRGADGKLTVLPVADPAIQRTSGNIASGEAMDVGFPAKPADSGPPDMSCLAAGTKLSATERALAARVKIVVASVMQPTVEYRYQPNASL